MPRHSSRLEPSEFEQEMQRAARLLAYAMTMTGRKPPRGVIGQAEDIYGKGPDPVPLLSALIEDMTEAQKRTIVYNPHSRKSRDLADWREEHQAADEERLREERAEAGRKSLVKSGLKKLSRDERKAPGFQKGQ